MPEPAFDIFVAPFDAVCAECEQNRLANLRRGSLTMDFVSFYPPLEVSQILQLGNAVSVLTGVEAEFGGDENRREPQGCLFVDRLDKAWVEAASKLNAGDAKQIQVQWVIACEHDEGERPVWADENHASLIERFIDLCHIATSAKTDMVMVWAL